MGLPGITPWRVTKLGPIFPSIRTRTPASSYIAVSAVRKAPPIPRLFRHSHSSWRCTQSYAFRKSITLPTTPDNAPDHHYRYWLMMGREGCSSSTLYSTTESEGQTNNSNASISSNGSGFDSTRGSQNRRSGSQTSTLTTGANMDQLLPSLNDKKSRQM
jgi:hypothetical protein